MQTEDKLNEIYDDMLEEGLDEADGKLGSIDSFIIKAIGSAMGKIANLINREERLSKEEIIKLTYDNMKKMKMKDPDKKKKALDIVMASYKKALK